MAPVCAHESHRVSIPDAGRSLPPTNASGTGEHIREVSEGARSGGDLATPLDKTAADLGMAYDVLDVAKAIVKIVDMPFGTSPFRVHIDPAQDGAEIVVSKARKHTVLVCAACSLALPIQR
jgi:hypothetical protein